MFDDIYSEFLFRIINAIPLFIVLKRACNDFCAPPRSKKEKANFHIILASTPFEKFCTTKNTIIVDEKDIGKITLEGYYVSCVLALVTAVELAINFGGSLAFAICSGIAVDFLLAFVGSVLKKSVLRLSSKVLTRHNIV